MAGFERFFRLYLLFAVFVLPLVFLQRCEEAYYLPKLAVLPGILPLVVFLKGIKPEKYDYLILGFLFFYAAGFFNGVSFFDVLSGLASWAAVITAYFYIKYRAAGSYREKLILSAAASAVLVAAYSVMQAFKLDLEGWASDFSGRAFSSLGNPDFLGGFLVIMIPAGFYIAAGLGRVKTGTAVFYFLITALILSQTRSSLIAAGCAAGLLVLFFREFFFRKALKINITAFVLAALVITASGAAGGLSGRIADAVTMKSADLSGRVKMWGIGAKMAAENPVFGMGAGAVKTNYHKFAGGGRYYETDRLHNDYIDMAASSGIPAAVLFILFIGVSGARLLREKGVFPRIFTAALAGTAIHAFFNFPFFIPDTQLYFFALLGCAAAAPARAEGSPARAVVLAAAAAAGALYFYFFLAITGGIYLNHAVNLSAAGKPPEAAAFMKNSGFYPRAKKYYYSAEINMKNSMPGEALRDIHKFTAKNPGSKPGALLSSIIHYDANDSAAAVEVLDGFLRYYPKDPQVLNNKAKIIFMEGDAERAAGIFRSILEDDPTNSVARSNLAAVYYSMGLEERAREAEEGGARWKQKN